ncbi:MAG: sel1 repeat family protein [Xanthomonadales bacterium]|nr:sel1 repeat family protein [Xanthomonadales bacterium]
MNRASTWGHPDLFGEFAGMKRLFKGDYSGALKYFKIGARYADKLSQLSIGMMYYNGRGVDKDQATACAWLMLAAEREYPKFVMARDRLCHSLSSTQHDQAMATLATLLPEYGDKVAKDRMKLVLATDSAALTGSHVGFDFGAITASGQGSNAMISCTGSQYIAGVLVPTSDCGSYSPNMLKAKNYFAARDAQWHGNVTVGALQQTSSLDAKTNKPDEALPSQPKPAAAVNQPQ